MICNLINWLAGSVMLFLLCYGAIFAFTFFIVYQSLKFRSDIQKAHEKKLGVKPPWWVIEVRDYREFSERIMATTSLFGRSLNKPVAIGIAVFAMILAMFETVNVCTLY